MCGICGIVSSAEIPLDVVSGRRMREMLAHRGPDDGGESTLGGHGALHGWLGHRRLSVVDLSRAAHQPMASDDGAVVLSYNGEIYNFRELRQELRALGHRFASAGDTEVVLRSYEAWGEDFAARLDGMFAVAVWDARRERLVLARDRTGKKPLFYSTAGDRLTFASELGALVSCPWVPTTVDEAAIPQYLTYGYVPWPGTMYREVHEIPPASVLVYDRDGVGPARPYWSPLPEVRQDLRPTEPVLGEVARLLEEATVRRMVADVPLGALLSGGIDSSLVVGLMSRHAQEPVHTFAIGFPEEPSLDERDHAQLVADHFGTRHSAHAVRLEAVALIDRLLWHHGQPFADSSAIPTFVVSEMARRDVTVVLNGDGGDEVFGGYDRFRAAALAMKVPALAGRLMAPGADWLPVGGSPVSRRRRARRFLERAAQPPLDRYQAWIAVTSEELLPTLLSPELRQLADLDRMRAMMHLQYAQSAALPNLDRVLYANLRTYLPSDLSVKVDRMSMAHGLEARSPFLDTALIDYVARIPARHKVGLRHVKPVLRNALWPLLPEHTWNRRKQGFGVPMNRWFRGELGTMFEDEVLSTSARSAAYLDATRLATLMRSHRDGAGEHGPVLWTVLMLERWLRSLERPVAERPPGVDIVEAG